MLSVLFENDRKAFLPERFRMGSALLLLRFGSITTTSRERDFPIRRESINRLVILSLLISRVLVVNGITTDSVEYGSKLNGIRIHTTYTEGVKVILLTIGVGVRRGSLNYVGKVGIYAFEYPLLKRLVILGLMMLVSSNDRLSLYLALELQSLCRYVLAAFRRGSAYSTEAGLKYFIRGAFASGLLLYGTTLIYGSTGSINFGDLQRLRIGGDRINDKVRRVGVRRVLMARLFKLSAAPFHMLSPDVYEGAPTSSSRFFAVVPKAGVLLLRVHVCIGPFVELFDVLQLSLMRVSILSIVVSVRASLVQRRAKRFLAYSAIGHVGYIRIGLVSGSREGIQGVRIYVMIYSLTALLMLTLIRSINQESTNGEVVPLKYRTDLGGLSRANPLLAITLALGMFSIAGVPPIAGFFAKAFVFLSAMSSSRYLLAIVGVRTSVVGAYNYLRLIKIAYFDSVKEVPRRVPVSDGASRVRGTSLSLITLFFINPSPVRRRTHRMALSRCS